MKLLGPIRDALLLAGLTLLVVLLHGYHLGVDDQAIYLPAIKKPWEGRGGECWRFHGTPVLGRCVQDAA